MDDSIKVYYYFCPIQVVKFNTAILIFDALINIQTIIIFLGSQNMLEDKIQHNIIKINQLTNDKESIRYIIPLYFNAIKYIYDNCTHCRIEPTLIEQVITKFKQFEQQKYQEILQLDQVHMFMVEESAQMIQSKHIQSKSQIKRHKLFSSLVQKEEQYLKEEEYIFIPQQSYVFEEQRQIINRQNTSSDHYHSKSNIIRKLSLDGIPSFIHSKEEICSLWLNVVRLHQEHKLDEAYEQCQKFQNNLFLCDPNCKLTDDKMQLIEKINEEYGIMQYYYQFFDEPGYIFDKEQKGIKMYSKIEQDTKDVSVRVQAELQISIDKFLCIVSEVDLFQEFVPFAFDTKQLMLPARNQKIGMTRVYIPLLSNRQAYFFAAAQDRLKTHNSIFFYSKTITSDYAFQKKIGFKVPKDSDLVELQYKFYILEYFPLTPTRGRVRLATNIDLKLKYLPLFIINKSCRIFAFDFFKNMMKVNKHFQGSLWEKKMQQNPDLYIFFKERIKQYLTEELPLHN